ncbi:hypothetical protein ABJI51_33310 [Amycolatopsis sp. NEAU-NG30]|uniref:Uncharacterized protein n=1 Tax=Amycolatopsis melonis TaxID=3156488 RepID=A0ABV0LNV0_9PSEU
MQVLADLPEVLTFEDFLRETGEPAAVTYGARKLSKIVQLDMFGNEDEVDREAFVRTRATFHDVIRATEVHRYKARRGGERPSCRDGLGAVRGRRVGNYGQQYDYVCPQVARHPGKRRVVESDVRPAVAASTGTSWAPRSVSGRGHSRRRRRRRSRRRWRCSPPSRWWSP